MASESAGREIGAVSFIVPAHNEESLLGLALQSIATAAEGLGLDFETIVVDDASTDRTAAVAAAAGARVIAVDLRQIAAVRNAGANQAAGDLLVFLDADTILPEDTLRAALDAIEAGAVGGGARVAFDDGTPWWGRLGVWGWNCLSRTCRWAAGCFIFVRRSTFEAAGGFDELYFAGEELYLSRALKRQGRFVILRQPVVSSGRQTRKHGFWKVLWTALCVVLRGPRGLRRREGLEVWYDRADL